MENVPEILNARYAKYYRLVASELNRTGYSLTNDVLDLSLYGVPQRRRRRAVVRKFKEIPAG